MRTASLIVAVIVLGASVQAAVAICGSDGGPGYRGSNGHCVGWERLNKICGNPPDPERCNYEGGGLTAGVPNKQTTNGKSTPRTHAPPVVSNIQPAKADGLGCVDQANIRAISSCAASRPAEECDRQRAELLNTKACFAIAGGTSATIEAGSHSFEWLRVRVTGTERPLWTVRMLFLKD